MTLCFYVLKHTEVRLLNFWQSEYNCKDNIKNKTNNNSSSMSLTNMYIKILNNILATKIKENTKKKIIWTKWYLLHECKDFSIIHHLWKSYNHLHKCRKPFDKFNIHFIVTINKIKVIRWIIQYWDNRLFIWKKLDYYFSFYTNKLQKH